MRSAEGYAFRSRGCSRGRPASPTVLRLPAHPASVVVLDCDGASSVTECAELRRHEKDEPIHGNCSVADRGTHVGGYVYDNQADDQRGEQRGPVPPPALRRLHAASV